MNQIVSFYVWNSHENTFDGLPVPEPVTAENVCLE